MQKTNDGNNRDKVALSVLKSAGNPGPCVLAKFVDQERQIVRSTKMARCVLGSQNKCAVVNAIQSGKSQVVGLDVLTGFGR